MFSIISTYLLLSLLLIVSPKQEKLVLFYGSKFSQFWLVLHNYLRNYRWLFQLQAYVFMWLSGQTTDTKKVELH